MVRKVEKDYQKELDDLIENKQTDLIMSKHLVDLRHLARAYAKVQRNRIAMDLSMQSYENQFMLKNGMAVLQQSVTEVPVVDEKDGSTNIQKRIGQKTVQSYELETDLVVKAEKERTTKNRVEKFRQVDYVYRMIQSYKNDLFNQEKGILEDGLRLLSGSRLLEWCKSVKGLGDVAAMSFAGYIDPTPRRITNENGDEQTFYPTVGHCLSYLGIVPGKAMRRGYQGNYNKKQKSIFIGIIAPNIIRSGDTFYKGLYDIKKEYHCQRPDLVFLAERGMKGWKGWINNMSIRVLMKFLISHAFDLLKIDYGMLKELPEITHHNPVPVKPDKFEDQQQVHRDYRTAQLKFLEKLKLEWANDSTENKTNYRQFLLYGVKDIS